MKSVNIDFKGDVQKMNQMKEMIERLEQENMELKQLIEKNNDIEKLNEIKQQIANEFHDLDSKAKTINLKETELAKKESDVKQLIMNYDYLFKSMQVQFEVTNMENKSEYIYSMNPIEKVMGIKLMSYSLPQPRFNVEENKNNTLMFKINDTEHTVSVKSGKYTIDNLITVLNNNIIKTIQDSDIKLYVNSEQNIVIESEKEFILIETILLKENFGFITKNDISNSYTSDRIWDLRIEDRVYLYLNNLSDDIPFGILYFNGLSPCQFKFENPYKLDKLEIVFKDMKGRPFNFHNLPHSLSFLVDRID